ncbi:MAG TPA: hypothetical protein DCO68_10135 [Methylophilaceae bacterium]|nr:hypothetical protein [Methylophilaceae bacterium]
MVIKQVLIAADQLLNTALGGWADETLSARIWRNKDKNMLLKVGVVVVNALFFWSRNHCYQAFVAELERKQYPRSYR